MSASSILTQGFGSFGGVSLLPTLGFGIGEQSQPIPSAVIRYDLQFTSIQEYSIQLSRVKPSLIEFKYVNRHEVRL